MSSVLWVAVGFLSGSIPYSILVAQWAGGGDIRHVGDGNPGAANVGRAHGWRWFTVAMLLDGFKGAIPVGLAWFVARLSGWDLVFAAIAPVLGHAFSPWLKLRGGKAVATTFGIWAGLTLWAGPTIFGTLLVLTFNLVKVSGWAVVLAFGAFGIILELGYFPAHPEFRAIWFLNLLVLVVKHLGDLTQPPGLRPWIKNPGNQQ